MASNKRPTQIERIVHYLTEHGSITQYDAMMELGVMRLASRVSEMKKTYGWKFEVEMVTVENRFGEPCKVAKYSLVG